MRCTVRPVECLDYGHRNRSIARIVANPTYGSSDRCCGGASNLKTPELPSRRGYGSPSDHFIVSHIRSSSKKVRPTPLCTVRPDFGRRDNSPDSRRYRRGRLVFGPEVIASAGRGDCDRTFISFVAVALYLEGRSLACVRIYRLGRRPARARCWSKDDRVRASWL
jgi:hypothetical protein